MPFGKIKKNKKKGINFLHLHVSFMNANRFAPVDALMWTKFIAEEIKEKCTTTKKKNREEEIRDSIYFTSARSNFLQFILCYISRFAFSV